MNLYAVLIEERVCLVDDCCPAFVPNEGCPNVTKQWKLHKTSNREGNIVAHISKFKRDMERSKWWARTYTGEWRIVVSDPATWKSSLSSDEEAAFRMNGWESVKRMRRAVEVAARAEARKTARAEKKRK